MVNKAFAAIRDWGSSKLDMTKALAIEPSRSSFGTCLGGREITTLLFQLWANCGQIDPTTRKRRLSNSRRSPFFKLCSEGGTRTRDTTIMSRVL